MKYLIALLLIIGVVVSAAGCGWAPFALKEATTEGIGIRRAVVGNDWVLIKGTGILYKRYLPGKGIGPLHLLKGNRAMLAKIAPAKRPGFLAKWLKGPFDGKVVRWNKDIIVYGSYAKALASGLKFTVSDESKLFVPVQKKPKAAPAWWTKERKEKCW